MGVVCLCLEKDFISLLLLGLEGVLLFLLMGKLAS